MDYINSWQVVDDQKNSGISWKIIKLFKRIIIRFIKKHGFFQGYHYLNYPKNKVILIYAQDKEYDAIIEHIANRNKLLHQKLDDMLNDKRQVGNGL